MIVQNVIENIGLCRVGYLYARSFLSRSVTLELT